MVGGQVVAVVGGQVVGHVVGVGLGQGGRFAKATTGMLITSKKAKNRANLFINFSPPQ